ncbi:MAG: hypothetical protein VW362_10640 [Candidatus Nanopelagicales bacterium]
MTTRAARRGVLRRAVLTRQAQPFALDRYQVFQLPPASQWTGAQVHVSDETGGAVTCFSDGQYWRRITDRTVVSAAVPAALSGTGAATGTLYAVAGPYLRGAGSATGTLRAASLASAGLSGAGVAAMTLQTPPKVPADLSAAGSATATARGASRVSAGLSGSGAATGTFYGVAA